MDRGTVIFELVLTVGGAVLGLLLAKLTDALELPLIAKKRRRALTGTWIGTIHQHANKNRPQVDVPVVCWIEPGYRRVRGTLMALDGDKKFYFSMEGALQHDRFLQLQYSAAGPISDAIDFGVCFLALRDYPDTIDGLYTGWGSISQSFITGVILLNKKTSAILSKELDYDALLATPGLKVPIDEKSSNPAVRSE